MLYISHPILETTADVIVVPIRLDGVIPTNSLQWQMVQKLGATYEMDFAQELAAERIKTGEPGVFIGENGVTVINFPILETNSNGLQLSDIATQLKEVVGFLKYLPACYTIAVPPLGKDYLWENVETMCQVLERHDAMIEFWLYPETEDWENNEIGDQETQLPEILVAS